MELTDQRILITGAAGFIGSHLADRLARNNELLLLDDFSIGRRENIAKVMMHDHVRVVEADITDRAQVKEAVDWADVVFHLAISCLRTSLGEPFMSHDINAGGTLNLLLECDPKRTKRFLYCSSSEVYGTAETAPMSESHPCRPTTVYGASKLAGELYALAQYRTRGLPVTVVRPFNTYGPREPHVGARAEVIPRFLLQLQAGRQPVIYGDGQQTRDFTYVEDTVEGIVLAAECDELVGDVVNIAFGREVSISEIARLLMEQTKTAHIGVCYEGERPGDVMRHFADTSKARRLLGFQPNTELSEGLTKLIEWFVHAEIDSDEATRESGKPNW